MPSPFHLKQPLKPKTFSFDVFDTCITRYCAQPADLFEPLFIKLLAPQGLCTRVLETTAKALARSRIQAEQSAREQSTRDDITLTEIYQALAPSLQPYGITPERASAEEIELELSAVSPIVSTQRYIRRLRLQGHRVVFISDMYLPGSVIRQMLIEHGFTNGDDSVYVSSDMGLSKGSGRLFSYACHQLGIEPKQLHHTGDSIYADIRGAQRLGVQTTFFAQGAPNRYETGFRSELIDNDWVRSHLVGLSRAVRLRHDFGARVHDQAGYERATLAADIMAPLFVGYVCWVLTTAQRSGIQQLYFADVGLLAIAQTLIWAWQHTHESQPDLPVVQSVASQPESPHKHSATVVLGWPTAGLPQPPSSDSKLLDPLFEASPATSPKLAFGLLDSIEQRQTICRQQTRLVYLEAPVSPYKVPEGTVYLFEYHQILKLLLLAANVDDGYQAILLDYAAAVGRSRGLKNHLDMLKRYATRNVVQFLASPEPADVRSLVAVQTMLQMDASAASQSGGDEMSDRFLARPVRLSELPAFGKRLLQGAKAKSAATDGRWIEGSLAISPVSFRVLLEGLSRLYHLFSQKLAPNRAKWFYRVR